MPQLLPYSFFLEGVLTAFYLLDEVDSVCSCGLFFLHVDLRVHVNE